MKLNLGQQRISLASRAVGERQRQRASAITPGEAAGAELAKFGAITGATNAAVGALDEHQQFEVRQQLAADELKAKGIQAETRRNLLKLEDEGLTDPDEYQKRADEILTEARGKSVELKNASFRGHFEQAFAQEIEDHKLDVSRAKRKIRVEQATAELNQGVSEALESGDYQGARFLLSATMAKDLVGQDQIDKALAEVDKAESQHVVRQVAGRVDQAYSMSEDAGDAEIAALMKREGIYTNLSDEERDMAIDRAEEKRTEWGAVRRAESEKQAAGHLLAYGDDAVRAEHGYMSLEELNASYKAGKYGDPSEPETVTRRNTLLNKIAAGLENQAVQADIPAMLANGSVPDDAKHRKALGEYELRVASTMEPEEQIQFIAETTRQAKVASETTSRALQLGSSNQESLAQNYPLWKAINSDPGVRPDLKIDSKAKDLYAHVHMLAESGMQPAMAAQTAWEAGSVDEAERIARLDEYENELRPGFDGVFGDFVDEHYDPGIFSAQPDAPKRMRVEYGKVYRSVYESTGDPAAAQYRASEAIRNNWKRTNINGRWEIQRYGVEGEAKVMRPSLVEASRESARGLKINGKPLSEVDDDDIRFEPMKPEGNEQRFRVYVGEVPVSRVSESGIEVLTVPVDMNTIEDELVTENKIKRIESRNEAIEKEIKNIQFAMEVSGYSKPQESRWRNLRTQRIEALEMEREANRTKLEEIKF